MSVPRVNRGRTAVHIPNPGSSYKLIKPEKEVSS